MEYKDELLALRNEIDSCDEKLTALFCKRMELASRVAENKKHSGMPVRDAARERELLLRIAERSGEFSDESRVLYSTILSLSRSYQQTLLDNESATADIIKGSLEKTPKLFPERAKVAVQGVEGAYSQLAATKLFELPKIEYCHTFEQVFDAVEKGTAQYGVLPIENSTAGSVGRVYDLMYKHSFYIVRTVRIKIDHCLLAKPGVKLSDIKQIYSHEQAINQCRGFLDSLSGVNVTSCANTAQAASMVASSPQHGVAALSSYPCAEIYGLSLLASNVQDSQNNHTRFICISAVPEIFPGADKSTVMTVADNRPGELYNLLSRFFSAGINITKLESRPIPEKDFEFMFCLDFEAQVYSPKLIELLSFLEKQNSSFRYLGSYSEVI